MLHHVSVGVPDVQQAAAQFYDSVLGALGYKRVMEVLPYTIGYGENTPEFWIGLPHDQKPYSAGNGVHIGFKAKSKQLVEAFYRAALAAGGTDEGEPGPRADYSPDYFGGFVRDPYGNKLEAVLAPEAAAAAKKAPARAKAKRTAAKAGATAKGRTKDKMRKASKVGATSKTSNASSARKSSKTTKKSSAGNAGKSRTARKAVSSGNTSTGRKATGASKRTSKKVRASAKTGKRKTAKR